MIYADRPYFYRDRPGGTMDPLSDVLSLLKPQSYMSGGLDAGGDWSFLFERYGARCIAVVSGHCWLSIDGVAVDVLLEAEDCVVLPWRRIPPRERCDVDSHFVKERPFGAAGWEHSFVEWGWRFPRYRRTLHVCGRSSEHLIGSPSAHGAHSERFRPGGYALVPGSHDQGAPRASTRWLSAWTTPRTDDADRGPATLHSG
jgi:hypothetical protein